MRPLIQIGEYLTRVANTQYDVVEANATFYVGGKPITIAVEGCPRSYFQLRKYDRNSSVADPSLTPADFEDWNKQVDALNQAVSETLNAALTASSCAFRDGDLRSAFPEFFAVDAFWSKTYDESGFLTDEEYEEQSKAQPALIDKAEFLKRMGCLKDFSMKPVGLSPKVCMVDRFEGSVRNAEMPSY